MIFYIVLGIVVAFLNYLFRKFDTRNFTDYCAKKPTVLCMILWVFLWPVVLLFLLWDVADSDIWVNKKERND